LAPKFVFEEDGTVLAVGCQAFTNAYHVIVVVVAAAASAASAADTQTCLSYAVVLL
jgi:hypothetical protein